MSNYIQEYLDYIQEIRPGDADLVASLAGAGTGGRLAVNLAIKAFNKFKSLYAKTKNPKHKAMMQKAANKVQQKKQELANG